MGIRTHVSRRLATFLAIITMMAFTAAPLHAVEPHLANAVAAVPAQEADLLGGLPPYLPKAPISGKLSVAGSSAMNQLAQVTCTPVRFAAIEAASTLLACPVRNIAQATTLD